MVHNPGGDWNPGRGGQPNIYPISDFNKDSLHLNYKFRKAFIVQVFFPFGGYSST